MPDGEDVAGTNEIIVYRDDEAPGGVVVEVVRGTNGVRLIGADAYEPTDVLVREPLDDAALDRLRWLVGSPDV